ncbi:uncharacterized protein LOC126176971 isoform X1 [Schistocerca cancellata]|uniref:uncharacterized protein LOC126176971 isoform X1 n=1 Tax=Schistocerca cancellata TaxID=274614 RepID=UPI0021176C25|nr:uncharacterized protein LOC126176971 isoform X1 [Schistocerca cancellata]
MSHIGTKRNHDRIVAAHQLLCCVLSVLSDDKDWQWSTYPPPTKQFHQHPHGREAELLSAKESSKWLQQDRSSHSFLRLSSESATKCLTENDFQNLETNLYSGMNSNLAKPTGNTAFQQSDDISNKEPVFSNNFNSATNQQPANLQLFTFQDFPPSFPCPTCGNVYRYKSSLARHVRLECGKNPQFHCPYCPHETKHKSSLLSHIESRHRQEKM